ncbi:prostaglandin reductase 1-like [Schistocerca piceifrons]|uniref:prostaglandin reductase 1-like n=1 Tax=Schistocerca piceifrons TaxID=274613 RepID=UPI001F5EB740|nr:prostaglandin reductase 1-like [Schistocerca piceifrons]XP_049939503.1 prostaglandin reductase 1-like [Schistocerca serialis cubense]
MVKARKIVLVRYFKGEPRPEDFRIEEEDLPPLKDGQILTEAVYFSVDPFQRILGSGEKYGQKVGDTMIGAQVARIVESRAAGFPVGRHVVAYWGWRDRTVADVGPDVPPPDVMSPPMLVPDLGDLPLSLSLGVLGMPGISAYFPLLEVCQLKAGEVVVVSGAAGAVGSIVGQIALIKGCTVIGFAGSESKVKWLKDDLGFHHVFNYKTTDVSTALKQAAPDGVDVYFDNVAGDMSTKVMSHMRYRGRITVIGGISQYNELESQKLVTLPFTFLANQLRIEGCSYSRWHDRWDEGISPLTQWVREGKLKYRETVTDGFVNTPKAFIGMLRGENFGKAVVKL